LLALGNPEPILAASFAADNFFPTFLGSCGRLAAFEDAGKALSDYTAEKWSVRVALARAALDLASGLTESGLYLTDWSADNLAVSPDDGRLVVVDAEDVILVDVEDVKRRRPPG